MTDTADHVHAWTTGARCACGAKRCVRWHCQAARAVGARCVEHAEETVVMIDTATVALAPHVHTYPTGGGRCSCGARRCRAQLCSEPRTLGNTCDRHASVRARQREADRLAQAILPGRPVRVTVYALPPACREVVPYHPERPPHTLDNRRRETPR